MPADPGVGKVVIASMARSRNADSPKVLIFQISPVLPPDVMADTSSWPCDASTANVSVSRLAPVALYRS